MPLLLHGGSLKITHETGLMDHLVDEPYAPWFCRRRNLEGTQLCALGFGWATKNNSPRLSILFGSLIVLSNWYWTSYGSYQLIVKVNITDGDAQVCHCYCVVRGLSILLVSMKTVFLCLRTYIIVGFQFDIPTPNFRSPPNPFAQSDTSDGFGPAYYISSKEVESTGSGVHYMWFHSVDWI